MLEVWPPRLAHCNVARLVGPVEDPLVSDFMAHVPDVNRVAERAPGFLWQLPDAHSSLGDDQRTIVNLSVWRSYEELHDFTYRTVHGHFARRRSRWFEPIQGPTTVLWWLQREAMPSVDEGLARLELLRRIGSSPSAFSLLRQFSSSGLPLRRATPRASAARRTR